MRSLSARFRFLSAIAATVPLVACGRHQELGANTQVDSLRVPILIYHNISPHHPGDDLGQHEFEVDSGVFAAQMNYIAEHRYRVISLDSLVTALTGAAVPARSVVITFDDGWKDQYDRAFPILHQLGFTATFFVYPSMIGRGSAFMTWDQLRALQAAGMTIGDHSMTHPILTHPEISLPIEIDSSRAEIQRQIGTAPDLFAYPYGMSNARVVNAVRAAGYHAARNLGDGPWNGPADLFGLRSVLVTNDMQAFARALGP